MVFIITALMIEAAPIIEYFKLKKDLSLHAYSVFRNNDIALVVSGIGKMQSAMASLYLLTAYNATKKDILINIGFCGANTREYELGKLLAINKITDTDTGRDYYPDVFICKDLPKVPLSCCSKLIRPEDLSNTENVYCDMESAGIMEAARKFIYSHQILILKIISDYMIPENLDKELLKGYIKSYLPLVEQKIYELKQLTGKYLELSMETEKQMLDKISADFKFSQAMEQILFKQIMKAKQRGLDPLKVFESLQKPESISKKEGKKIFEQLIEKLRHENF